jgi:hypothetical protein
MRDNKWARLLAYVTGLVNQRLLLQKYLIAENRILRSHLPTRLRLSDPERSTLAEIGKRVGRKDLKLVASVALPDTILAWYRRLIAQKFDGSNAVVLLPNSAQLVGAGVSAVPLNVPLNSDFLSACPVGEHFAFYEDDSFHVWSGEGREIWSRGINTDKAAPHRIRFSLSGDAVACVDDWDGLHRLPRTCESRMATP